LRWIIIKNMNNISKKLSAALVLATFLSSCGSNSSNVENASASTKGNTTTDTSKTNQTLPTPTAEATAPTNANYKFDIKSNGDEDLPKSKISVTVNGKKNVITTMHCPASEIRPDEYETYDIPKNAISACGAWWAGAGEYAYMTIVGNTIEVFYGWNDETQTDEGYHWKKRKRLHCKI
jgi:hypothetical protein